jgi:hypothetical protein
MINKRYIDRDIAFMLGLARITLKELSLIPYSMSIRLLRISIVLLLTVSIP